MKIMKRKKKSYADLIRMVLEIMVALGFSIGLFPFGYYAVLWWVIPLALTNLILSLIENNGTQKFTIINSIMVFLAIIPIIGVIPRMIGIVIAILSASVVGERYFSR